MAGGWGRGSGLGFCSSPGEGAMLSGESRHGGPELREEGGWRGGGHRALAVVSLCGFPFRSLPGT